MVLQIGYRLANKVSLVHDATYFSQSASTVQSDDTALNVNFGNAWIKKDKETLPTRFIRKYEGILETPETHFYVFISVSLYFSFLSIVV
jgi:hypothetical protein